MSGDIGYFPTLDEIIANRPMAEIPVYMPVTPFTGIIPSGLRPGVKVHVKGLMNAGANRFKMNLQTGCASTDDIAFHLSVQRHEQGVLRNHRIYQEWGTEERFGDMPLYPGQFFDILILAEESAFKVDINGVHFCMFQYRVPLDQVKYINVQGDATIHCINLEDGNALTPEQN